MRHYNVYLYSECPVEQNVDSYPSYWIWKVENCCNSDEIPAGAQRMTLTELMAYKQVKKADINAWTATKITTATLIDKKVKKALHGVNNVISKYCAENIVKGITQAGKTKLIADALKDVFYYAQTGSLYECLTALDALEVTPEMSPFLTEQIRTEFKSKIEDLISTL